MLKLYLGVQDWPRQKVKSFMTVWSCPKQCDRTEPKQKQRLLSGLGNGNYGQDNSEIVFYRSFLKSLLKSHTIFGREI